MRIYRHRYVSKVTIRSLSVEISPGVVIPSQRGKDNRTYIWWLKSDYQSVFAAGPQDAGNNRAGKTF